jgi:hypothetical protein
MPDGTYYRKQAQLFARLAITSSDPQTTARYNEMALEQLAKADDAPPGDGHVGSGGVNPRPQLPSE